MYPGSRHEAMTQDMFKVAQLQQLKQELALNQGDLAQQQQQWGGHQQQHEEGGQQQQQNKNEGRGRKKNKKNNQNNQNNQNNNDPWGMGGGGGGGNGGWADNGGGDDPWGVTGGGGGGGGGGRGGGQQEAWGSGGQDGGDLWQNGGGGDKGWGAGGDDDWANPNDGDWAADQQGGGGGGGGGWKATPASEHRTLHSVHHQGSHRNSRHAPGMSATESWGGWGRVQGTSMDGGYHGGNGKTPKVTITAPTGSDFESHTVVSPKQNNHLFQSLFQSLKGGGNNGQRGRSTSDARGGKKGKKNKKQHGSPYASPWQGINTIDEEDFEEDFDRDGNGRDNDWYNGAATGWDDQTYSMPSKAYALAGHGQDPVGMHKHDSPYMEMRFVESQGHALGIAQKAFYSQDRVARNRIHWLFDPEKDERVSTLLAWIQQVSPQLGAFGVSFV